MKRRYCIAVFLALCMFRVPAPAQELVRISTGDSIQVYQRIVEASKVQAFDPDSAFALLQEAYTISRRLAYLDGIGRSLLGMAYCLADKREYERSKRYFYQAYPYCVRAKNRTLTTQFYNALAVLHTQQGRNDSAIEYYYRSLEELRKNNIRSASLQLMVYANIGGVLSNLDQYEQSVYYSRRALTLAIQEKDTPMLAQIYTNIGTAMEPVNADSSLYYLNKSLPYLKSARMAAGLQNAYYNIGRVYLLFKDSLQTAMLYFDKAVAVDEARAEQFSALQQGIGGALFKKGNYRSSIAHYLKALSLCDEQQLSTVRLPIYYTLATIYDSIRKPDSAFYYQRLYADLKDSVLNDKNISTVNQLEVKYRTSEKDKEIVRKKLQLVQRENEIRKKNSWILGISICVAFLAVLLIFIYRSYIHKQRLHAKHIQNLSQQQEIIQLKAQCRGEEEERVRLAREIHDGIVAHFSAVKMNLSVLPENHRSLEDAADYKKIVGQLDHATHALRKTAHNLMPDVLLENGLAEAIFYFCKDLEQNAGLHIDYQQYVEVPRFKPEWELSLYRIVQELLQNIVKHAEATEVLVQLSYTNDMLNITVEDNGKGFDAAASRGEGIGIRNLRARVHAMKGHLDIDSRPGSGTTVYIEITDKNLYL